MAIGFVTLSGIFLLLFVVLFYVLGQVLMDSRMPVNLCCGGFFVILWPLPPTVAVTDVCYSACFCGADD